MSLINHYSTLWGLGIFFALSAYFLLRGERSTKKKIALTLIGIALIVTWFAIRPQSGSDASSSTLRAEIGQGTPVLLELQSPYWAACAAAKPIVDGLEGEFSGELIVIRVDVQAENSKDFAREFGSMTPTFVFFDADGTELWRTIGSIDAEQVRQEMQ